MHKALILLILIVSACTPQKEAEFESRLDWLQGEWVRTNDQEGRETFENWQKDTLGYKGLGFTLAGGDTVFKEIMSIEPSDSLWILKVSGVNKTPTIFTLTQMDSTSFTAINPKHDFPKKIAYVKSAEGFKAEVSADSMKIEFDFIRI
ncbi:DUF6265 family protein [Jiulongibacter sp. NS-SX5]|uniref:DUF6265 family protein n=1 Tax=Jiulongibacter sp. NS-SX5 TaxID=3463854 RepID=UPI00405A2F55